MSNRQQKYEAVSIPSLVNSLSYQVISICLDHEAGSNETTCAFPKPYIYSALFLLSPKTPLYQKKTNTSLPPARPARRTHPPRPHPKLQLQQRNARLRLRALDPLSHLLPSPLIPHTLLARHAATSTRLHKPELHPHLQLRPRQ